LSWVAHDMEPYTFQAELKTKVAFLPLMLGSWSPDLFTKWFVYGDSIFGTTLRASNPTQFHRGWPGAGFTHSLAYGVLIGLLIYAFSHSRIWAVSFVIGSWAHVLTDVGDTVGTMLFFPFSTYHVSLGAWAYAGQLGRMTDAAAYFSGLGWVWDGVWVLLAVYFAFRGLLSTRYFRSIIYPTDPFWAWIGRRGVPESAMVVLYRGVFFWGTCRWIAWLIWAHVVHSYPFDLSWGGPHWVMAEHL
jgi:LexA-binding, inner membrane-associated putative hydrolase